MTEVEKVLSDGLLAGYAAPHNEHEHVRRGPVLFEASEYVLGPDYYRDEWSSGGGQEVATDGKKHITRLYGGGVASEKMLENAEVTEKEVLTKLGEFIRRSEGRTRLYSDHHDQIDEQASIWWYDYSVISSLQDIKLTTGMEEIYYNGWRVFAHAFIISHIK
jgi:hypothetical protein